MPVTTPASNTVRGQNVPPAITDMVHTNGDLQNFHNTRLATSRLLQDSEFSWEVDVEAVYPIKKSFWTFAQGSRPQSFRHRTAFRIDGKSPDNIRKALEKGISSRPLFRTILVTLPDNTLVHVVLRPGRELYQMLISERREYDEGAIQHMILDDASESFSDTQMFQAVIATSQHFTTLILTYNHSVFDGALDEGPRYACRRP